MKITHRILRNLLSISVPRIFMIFMIYFHFDFRVRIVRNLQQRQKGTRSWCTCGLIKDSQPLYWFQLLLYLLSSLPCLPLENQMGMVMLTVTGMVAPKCTMSQKNHNKRCSRPMGYNHQFIVFVFKETLRSFQTLNYVLCNLI